MSQVDGHRVLNFEMTVYFVYMKENGRNEKRHILLQVTVVLKDEFPKDGPLKY